MFANMKIGLRLALGFAAVLVLLLAVAAVGYTRISALNVQVEGLVNDKFPKTVAANDVIESINVIARRLRNAYIFKDAESAKEVDAIPEQRKIISRMMMTGKKEGDWFFKSHFFEAKAEGKEAGFVPDDASLVSRFRQLKGRNPTKQEIDAIRAKLK